MRSGKTSGGLVNITHNESARTKWLLSAHVIAQYTDAIRDLTGIYAGTWSEQHREASAANSENFGKDLGKMVGFLSEHN